MDLLSAQLSAALLAAASGASPKETDAKTAAPLARARAASQRPGAPSLVQLLGAAGALQLSVAAFSAQTGLPGVRLGAACDLEWLRGAWPCVSLIECPVHAMHAVLIRSVVWL